MVFIHFFSIFKKEIKQLHEQYRNRTCGDNGLSKGYSIINTGIDLWIQKLSCQIMSEKSGKAKSKFGEGEWSSFFNAIDDWQDTIQFALKSIGWPLRHLTDLQPASALKETKV